MPKVLHVIARINRGGTARYLENLVPGLQELGWEVLIVTGSVQHGESEDPIVARLPVRKIKYLGRKIAPIQDFLARKQIKKTIREFQPDIIQTHTFKAGLLARTIKLNIPLIHTYHGHLLFDPEFAGIKLKIIILSERFLSKRANSLLATGVHVINDLVSMKIGENDKFISIEPSIRKIPLLHRSMALNLLGLDTSLPIVVWLGRLTSVKNPEILREIALETPDFFFAIFGDGELRKELSQNSPPNLKFFGWIDPSTSWSIADVALITSKNEGLSNTLIEATRFGLPIVATDIQGNREILDRYESVVLVSHSVKEFSDGIRKALSLGKTVPRSETTQREFSASINSLYRELGKFTKSAS
jgi:glycosyltransferase involved in cell wall biosynthesis